MKRNEIMAEAKRQANVAIDYIDQGKPDPAAEMLRRAIVDLDRTAALLSTGDSDE